MLVDGLNAPAQGVDTVFHANMRGGPLCDMVGRPEDGFPEESKRITSS